MSFLLLALTFWLMFSLLLFSSDPVLSHLLPVSSPSSLPHQMPEQERITSVWVMSNLYTSLSLCVFLYLPSILNQEMVARTNPRACQRITLPVCVPTSGLCFPAWLWLWSWLSMPYRSARRRKKRSSTHKLIPKAEGVISETDIKKAESLGSWHKWHLWKRKNKRRKKAENIEMLQLWICCSFNVILGQITTVMEHTALRKTLAVRRHEGYSLGMILPLTETQTPGGLKWIMSKNSTLFSPKGGREGMNNIIKRRQDWRKRNCFQGKRDEQEVIG